jgi:hypothetical protein
MATDFAGVEATRARRFRWSPRPAYYRPNSPDRSPTTTAPSPSEQLPRAPFSPGNPVNHPQTPNRTAERRCGSPSGLASAPLSAPQPDPSPPALKQSSRRSSGPTHSGPVFNRRRWPSFQPALTAPTLVWGRRASQPRRGSESAALAARPHSRSSWSTQSTKLRASAIERSTSVSARGIRPVAWSGSIPSARSRLRATRRYFGVYSPTR